MRCTRKGAGRGALTGSPSRYPPRHLQMEDHSHPLLPPSHNSLSLSTIAQLQAVHPFLLLPSLLVCPSPSHAWEAVEATSCCCALLLLLPVPVLVREEVVLLVSGGRGGVLDGVRRGRLAGQWRRDQVPFLDLAS